MAAPKKKKTKSEGQKKHEPSKIEDVKKFFNDVKPVPEYVKHLVECRCVLPQYKEQGHNHKFIVFSELDEQGNVKPSYAQCNNCNIIHKVTEVGVSITLKREELKSLPRKEEIKNTIPDWLSGLLENYGCELHVWQEAAFIFVNELWGRYIILSKEQEDNLILGKICQILGTSLYKIENFEEEK